MEPEFIICIPGTWSDRSELLQAVITSTEGRFMFAGGNLAFPGGKDHVELTYAERTPEMATAFRYAGQGKISEETLEAIDAHQGVAYLHFPLQYLTQRDRLHRFTEVLSKCGGIAVKNESSGIAHEWTRWFELLDSDHLFDAYCACVVLVGEEGVFYSCGMHHFGLPETRISQILDSAEAASLTSGLKIGDVDPRVDPAACYEISDKALAIGGGVVEAVLTWSRREWSNQ